MEAAVVKRAGAVRVVIFENVPTICTEMNARKIANVSLKTRKVVTREPVNANAKSAGMVIHVLVHVHTSLTGKIVAKLADVVKMEILYSAYLIMEPAYALLALLVNFVIENALPVFTEKVASLNVLAKMALNVSRKPVNAYAKKDGLARIVIDLAKTISSERIVLSHAVAVIMLPVTQKAGNACVLSDL